MSAISNNARSWLWLAICAASASGVAVASYTYYSAAKHRLCAALSEQGGVPISIGTVDATLTASIWLRDVKVGELISAKAIGASVAFSSLIEGNLSADEIEVHSPTLNASIDKSGTNQLRDLFRRFSPPRQAGSAPSQRRVRRIVVTNGQLTIAIADHTTLSANEVELSPEPGGVRVVTGEVKVEHTSSLLRSSAFFRSSSFDLELPTFRVGRLLAVGGTGNASAQSDFAPAKQLNLSTASLYRATESGPIEFAARVTDSGVTRRVQATIVAERPFAVTVHADDFPLGMLTERVAFGQAHVRLAGAHATGSATFALAGSDVAVQASGRVSQLKLYHPRLDEAEIDISPSLRVALSFNREQRAIAFESAQLDILAAKLGIRGEAKLGTTPQARISVELAEADCNQLLASVPANIRAPLDGLTMSGSVTGGITVDVDLARADGDGVRLASTVSTSHCKVLSDPPLADVKALLVPSRHTFPNGKTKIVGPGVGDYVEFDRLSPLVRGAFVSAEDGRFDEHRGFDLDQIARSFEINLRDHKLNRGGSTISQQLVKNSFLTARRTFGRKLQEAVLTWRMEDELSKKQILERYLNIIELGPDIFGVANAAQHWFDMPLRDLNPRQAAFLAALTSEPKSMTKRIRAAGELDEQSRGRIDTILRAMRRDHVISNEDYIEAKDAPVYLRAKALGK